jgi:hypothetical protein
VIQAEPLADPDRCAEDLKAVPGGRVVDAVLPKVVTGLPCLGARSYQ